MAVKPEPRGDTEALASEAVRAAEALAKAIKALSNRCRADKRARAAIREAAKALGHAVRDASEVADCWDADEDPRPAIGLDEVKRRLAELGIKV